MFAIALFTTTTFLSTVFEYATPPAVPNGAQTAAVASAAPIPCYNTTATKPVSVSASDSVGSNYSAEKSVDGSIGTYWIGSYLNKLPKWLQYDFGLRRCFSRVAIYVHSVQAPVTYTLESSNDGQIWSIIFNNKVLSAAGWNQITLPAAEARYLRLTQSAGAYWLGILPEIAFVSTEALNTQMMSVSQDTLSSTGVADGKLLRFKVTASPESDVSLASLSFKVSFQNVALSGVNLYAYTDSTYSVAIANAGSGGKVQNNVTGSLLSGDEIKITVQDANGLPSTLVIPAGETRYFELRAVSLVSYREVQSSRYFSEIVFRSPQVLLLK